MFQISFPRLRREKTAITEGMWNIYQTNVYGMLGVGAEES